MAIEIFDRDAISVARVRTEILGLDVRRGEQLETFGAHDPAPVDRAAIREHADIASHVARGGGDTAGGIRRDDRGRLAKPAEARVGAIAEERHITLRLA